MGWLGGRVKNTLFAFFITLLIVGSEGSPKPSEGVDTTDTTPMKDAIKTAIEWSELQDRDGVTYLPNTDKPFSGYAKRRYENEQMEILAQIKDGYVVRLKQWQENGNPKWDVGLMEGKVGVEGMPNKIKQKLMEYGHGPATHWHDNGQKQGEGNLKDGKPEGLFTLWHENGQKQVEGNYKDGKLISAVSWKPNGEKCPVTNVKDGDGIWVLYNEDGTEVGRQTYKYGNLVEP